MTAILRVDCRYYGMRDTFMVPVRGHDADTHMYLVLAHWLAKTAAEIALLPSEDDADDWRVVRYHALCGRVAFLAEPTRGAGAMFSFVPPEM